MKKIFTKITNHKKDKQPVSNRITADTVALHRQKILSGGRRFKYPIQYEKHKLVFNTIIIGVAAVVVAIIIGWWQLYLAQNTSEFMYRVTRVIPVAVAKIDGQDVTYSDYLMKYRSSVHYLQQKEQVDFNTKDGKKRVDYLKRESMSDALADAYAAKLAQNLHITVSDSELSNFLKNQRKTSDGEISEQTYDSVILDYYGWTLSEYRSVMRTKLLRQKVSYAVDTNAKKAVNIANTEIKKNPSSDFRALAAKIGFGASYGNSGWVPKTNQDGGLAIAATKLAKNGVSPVIKTTNGSGYYIVRLVDMDDTKVNYEYIQIPLTTFDSKFKKIESSSATQIYIAVKV